MFSNRPGDETPDALADRLRRLPPPPLLSGLEARLLAAIPVAPRLRGRRGRSWIAAAVLLAAAAAALLAVRLPPRLPPPAPSLKQPADDAPTLGRYEQALRYSDADAAFVLNRDMPPFEWPAAGSDLTLHSSPLQ